MITDNKAYPAIPVGGKFGFDRLNPTSSEEERAESSLPARPTLFILALDNLHKQYGALSVTQDFSLEVELGEIVGILGPNGAGKTTLFNLITGTVRPQFEGRIIFDGRDVTALDSSPSGVV